MFRSIPLLHCLAMASFVLLLRSAPACAQSAFYGANSSTLAYARPASGVYSSTTSPVYGSNSLNVSNQVPPARPLTSSQFVAQNSTNLQPFPEEITPYGPSMSSQGVPVAPNYGVAPAPGQQYLPPSGFTPTQDPFQEQLIATPPVDSPCGPDDPCNFAPQPPSGFRWFGLMDLLDRDYGVFYNPTHLDDHHLLSKWTAMNFSVFGGFQGFKGPVDEGQGSNFGFHEGFNWAVPLFEKYGISHQTGVQGVHSDLSGGSQMDSHRNQFFLTSGFYYRPLCGTGFQCGIVTDYLHDDWYSKSDLDQIRAEMSLVGKIHELGLIGIYHTDVANKTSPTTGNQIQWQAYDQYLAFYRRRLHGIGHGRLWGGLTGNGDTIIGGDGISPLSTHWAFQSNFNYVFPRGESLSQSYNNQSWTLSLNIVFYPGYVSPKSALNPFRPMFDVADNTIFLINQHGQ